MPFLSPGESSRPRNRTCTSQVSCLGRWALHTGATWVDVTLLLFKLLCRWLFLQPQQTLAGPLVRQAKSDHMIGPARAWGRGQRVSGDREWGQRFQKATGRVQQKWRCPRSVSLSPGRGLHALILEGSAQGRQDAMAGEASRALGQAQWKERGGPRLESQPRCKTEEQAGQNSTLLSFFFLPQRFSLYWSPVV